MELTAWLAGEPHSDHPHCVSPEIARFMRAWNDRLNDDDRQLLLPYTIRVIGTNTGPVDDERRVWLAIDWLARVQLPAWLELVPSLRTHAERIRALEPLTSHETARAASPVVRHALRGFPFPLSNAREWNARAWDMAWTPAWDMASISGPATQNMAWEARNAAATVARYAEQCAEPKAIQATKRAIRASLFDLLDRLIAIGSRDVATIEDRMAVVRAAVTGQDRPTPATV